ncbi:hypothetical protein GQX66_03050 [Pseudomonas sp. B707]|nr:hypothetical protein [Pseudomonas sp. B707]
MNLSPSSFLARNIESSLLYNSKYITHVLHHDPGNGGHSVDVVFCMVGEADAGHQIQVFENGVKALTGTSMEVPQWGVSVDEQDGSIGSGVGHVRAVAHQFLCRHGVNPLLRRIATVLLRNKMGGSYARVRRPED